MYRKSRIARGCARRPRIGVGTPSRYLVEAMESRLLLADPVAVYAAMMDADPGWSLDPGASPYQWQYGTPAGMEGDPASGHTGNGLMGYNLAGAYPNGMWTTEYATTPPFSTLGKLDLRLGFWRWLGVESATYDRASIQVWDGATWVSVWSHAGHDLYDGGWLYQEYALPASAEDRPDVRIRWGMGPTDGSVNYCGWNIDDVVVSGTPAGGLVISDTVQPTNDALVVLPSVAVGQVGSPEAFTLRNRGDTPVQITDLRLAGPDAEQFSFVAKDSFGTVLPEGFSIPAWGACTIEARLSPTSAGDMSATITFATTLPDMPAVQLQVSGRSIALVTIPDPQLRSLLEETVGTPITEDGMLRLSFLSGEYAGIADLTGLECAKNLEWLWMGGNEIEDLGPLAGLTHLQEIDLLYNHVTDVTPLLGLPSLYSLQISHNGLDVQPGSDDMSAIAQLQAGGVWVYYLPQGVLQITDDVGDERDMCVTTPTWDAGGVGLPATFWLYNDGPNQLAITDLHLAGTDASQFQVLVLDEYGSPVAPGDFSVPPWETYAMEVRLAATYAGAKAATISFSAADPLLGTAELQISGLAEEPVPVLFPDPGLDAAVRAALGRPTGDITQRQLGLLEELDAVSAGIIDLSGLELATSLERLNLSGNAIADLDVFSPISTITALQLFFRGMGSEEVVAELDATYHLGLETEASSALVSLFQGLGNLALPPAQAAQLLSVLSRITQLDNAVSTCMAASDPAALILVNTSLGLGLSAAQIEGIAAVLGAIGSLPLSSSLLAGVGKVLRDPVRMSSLLLFCEVFGDSVALSSLNTAADIGLDGARLNGMVDAMRAIAGMRVHQAEIADLAAILARISNPDRLFAFCSVISSPATIAGINARHEIGMSLAQIGAVSRVLSRLGQLHMGDGVLSDIAAAVQPFSQLSELDLSGNRITSLTALSGLTALDRLSLSHNQIADVSPLSALRELDELELGSNSIADVAPLACLRQLDELDLSNNAVVDIGPLASLRWTESLILSGNRIVDTGALASLDQLQFLDLSHNAISDLGVFSQMARFAVMQRVAAGIASPAVLAALNQVYGLELESDTIAGLSGLLAGIGGMALPEDEVVRLLDAMARIDRLDRVLAVCAAAADVQALAQANSAFALGLTQGQMDAIATTLAGIGSVSMSERLYSELGLILAQSNNMTNLMLFCGRFGDPSIIGAMNAASGLGLDVDEVDRLAATMQALAAISVHEGILVDFAAALGRVIHPGKVFSFFGEIGEISRLEDLNRRHQMGLTNSQIAMAADVLENLGDLAWAPVRNDTLAAIARCFQTHRNLWHLDLSGNRIADVSGLGGLSQIQELYIADNRIQSFVPLARLKDLAVLDASGNAIGDISAVAALTGLTELRLAGNAIGSISPLARLWRLESLDLSGNQIADAGSLVGLDRLVQLDLAQNPVEDLAPMSGAAKVDAMQILARKIGDERILAELSSAYRLNLDSDAIVELSGMLAGLGDIDLPSRQLASLVSGLSRMVNLPKLREYCAMVGNPLVLGLLNSRFDLGLTPAERAGISDVLLSLSEVGVTTSFFRDIGTIMAQQGAVECLLLFCGRVGTVEVIGGLNDMAGMGMTPGQVRSVADMLQSIAALKPYEALLCRLAELTSRITNPQRVFDFFRDLSPMPVIAGVNRIWMLGLSDVQIAVASQVLASLGRLSISNRVLADIGTAFEVLPRMERLSIAGALVSDIGPIVAFGALAELDVSWNLLDLAEGTEARNDLNELMGLGVQADFLPQKVIARGGSGDDEFHFSQVDSFAELRAGLLPSGEVIRSVPITPSVDRVLLLESGAGNDIVAMDIAGGVDILPRLRFDGGDGTDLLRVVGAAPAAALSLTGTELDIDGQAMTISGVEWVAFESSSLSSLALSENARLRLGSDGTVVRVQSFTTDASSTLDLLGGQLVIAANSINRDQIMAAVTARIASARNGGPGITTSAGREWTVSANLNGDGDVVLGLWLMGDFDSDLQLDGDDYFALDEAFLSGFLPNAMERTDVTMDGVIDGRDYFLVDRAFLATVAAKGERALVQSGVFATEDLLVESLGDMADVLA